MAPVWAFIDREMRRFVRNRPMIFACVALPIAQLLVMGYAIGGTVRHVKVGLVNQDAGIPALKFRELTQAAADGAGAFAIVDYSSLDPALSDLRAGRLNGVLTIPPDFSRRVLQRNGPSVAFVRDNSDVFVSAALERSMGGLAEAFNEPVTVSRIRTETTIDSVELYSYVPYIQYLLPGVISLAIFMVVMVGGGVTFIDDKARGLHEGYLVTPVTRLELIAGFNLSGAIKGVIIGCVVAVAGVLVAQIPDPLSVTRFLRMLPIIALTSSAMISLMFLILVRAANPIFPRAVIGMLNTILYFPSGAVYPQTAFPEWMQALAVVDPFTYSVHAFRVVLLKNAGMAAIAGDLTFLAVFTVVTTVAATAFFRRSL